MGQLILENKSKLDEQVKIKCYGVYEEMTRRDALEHYFEMMKGSEGSEHERYESIFFQLLLGQGYCTDDLPMQAI